MRYVTSRIQLSSPLVTDRLSDMTLLQGLFPVLAFPATFACRLRMAVQPGAPRRAPRGAAGDLGVVSTVLCWRASVTVVWPLTRP
jgi:hypothetical protein